MDSHENRHRERAELAEIAETGKPGEPGARGEPGAGAETVALADVYRAARRLKPFVLRTPLERSAALSAASGRDVWLKLECFQRTGSFKLRGALNALLGLSPAERFRGVVTASAGNHGLGIARAAELVDVAATVVIPTTASPAKVQALRRSGAELVSHGADYDEAEAEALRLARDRGAVYVSPYNDPAVIAGGGTLALEILEDLPAAGTLVVPAGGGGLISGIGVATKAVDPATAVIGVQSTASPALQAALAAGHIMPVAVADSLADGLAGNLEPGSLTFDLARRYVDRILLVEEVEIARAIVTLIEEERLLVEGSAAITWAALQRGLVPTSDRPVVLVLTGRNIAATTLQKVLASA